MKVALVDNGSLEPEVHRALRCLASAVAKRAHVPVDAVSWKHSNRIPRGEIDDRPAALVLEWLRREIAAGERTFILLPFLLTLEGAVGSALRAQAAQLRAEHPDVSITFADDLAASGAIRVILIDRIAGAVEKCRGQPPAIVIVDHGGPAPEPAALRNSLAADVAASLGDRIGPLAAASLQGAEYAHNHPQFRSGHLLPGFAHGDVIVAPLFLGPGRHATQDIRRIAKEMENASQGALRFHFIAPLGTHALVVETLTRLLERMLANAAAMGRTRSPAKGVTIQG